MTSVMTFQNDNDYANAPMTAEELDSLLGDLGNEKLRIVQPTSKIVGERGAQVGKWWIGEGDIAQDDIPDPLVVRPLRISRRRRLWVDSQVACESQDGFVGAGDPGGDCMVCPHNVGGSQLVCGYMIVYVLYLEGLDIEVEYEMYGMAERAARRIGRIWQAARGKARPSIPLKIQLAQSKKGVFYLPTVV